MPATAAQARSKVTALEVPGKCRSLVIAGDRLTGSCMPVVVLADVKSKGGMILVPLKPLGAYNFYVESVAPGKTRLLAVELSSFPVSNKHYAVPVIGTCKFGDYTRRATTISCSGKDINGLTFKLEFATGRPKR